MRVLIESKLEEKIKNIELRLKVDTYVEIFYQCRDALDIENSEAFMERVNEQDEKHHSSLKTVMIWTFVEIVEDLAMIIHLFHDSPLKVIQWVTYELYRYTDRNLANTLKDCILLLMNDKHGFDLSLSNIKFIKNELSKTDFTKDIKVSKPPNSKYVFFTGENTISGEKYLNSFSSVAGMYMTKKESARHRLNQSRTEILGILKEEGYTIIFPTSKEITYRLDSPNNQISGEIIHTDDFTNANNEISPPDDPTDKRMERTREFICDKFEAMHTNGWQYAFKDENDYNTFVEILSDFFVNESCIIPENIINLNRNTKTRLARTLNEIYNYSKDDGAKIHDSKFYDLVRCLNHFEKLNNIEIYNAMTK